MSVSERIFITRSRFVDSFLVVCKILLIFFFVFVFLNLAMIHGYDFNIGSKADSARTMQG